MAVTQKLLDRLTSRMASCMKLAHGAYQRQDRVRMRRYAIESQGWDELRQLTEEGRMYFRKSPDGKLIFVPEET